ncbi:MAG: hypothetical protein Q8867_08665 [Bacteroidota bacterium]|nr:hypothetical protein [Bacteroidota bacterium]
MFFLIPLLFITLPTGYNLELSTGSLPLQADSTDSIAKTNLRSVLHDFSYKLAFSGRLVSNWKHDNYPNQIILLQDLRYQIRPGRERKAMWLFRLDHQAGIQYIFDSITQIHTDENTLNTTLDFQVLKPWNISFFSLFSTPLFNSLFLTPLRWTFSAGLSVKREKFGVVNIGLTGGRLTYVRNRKIYEKLGIPVFYGVPEDKKTLLEYGLSLQILIDRNLWDKIRWNGDFLFFKSRQKPVDLSVKNSFSLQVSRYIRTGIQTRLFYEKMVSPKLQMENLISAGFSFDL